MAERETVDRVRERQGVLSEIQNFFTRGYGTKEDLRELDRKLRDLYYADLRDLRHVWEGIYLGALNAGVAASSGDFKKVIQVMDRVMEEVRHADYGYAGLMDRKGSIRETGLARVFDYDRALAADIEALEGTVKKIHGDAEAGNWAGVPDEVKKVKGLLLAFEDKWRERENRFRPLEV